MASVHAFARGNCGNEIVFNCDNHTVNFQGETTTIDCGRATYSKTGHIGQPGRGAGSVFPSMKGAPILNLIPTPTASGRGNVVVHLLPPKNGRCPIGTNRGAGCIHVCPYVLERMNHCYGTPYRVIFSGRGKFQMSARPIVHATPYVSPPGLAPIPPARQAMMNSWAAWWAKLFSGQFSDSSVHTPNPYYDQNPGTYR
jgi:hypothetical protein